MARPTEYNSETLTSVAKYLEICTDEVEQLVSGESEKFTKYENRLKVKLPSIEGLALYLGIHKDTIYAWEKLHPEFSDVIGDLRAKQAEALINNGLSGAYNSTIAKVLLTKHGYRDQQEIDQKTEHSGTVGFTGINIIKPNEPGSSEEIHP